MVVCIYLSTRKTPHRWCFCVNYFKSVAELFFVSVTQTNNSANSILFTLILTYTYFVTPGTATG